MIKQPVEIEDRRDLVPDFDQRSHLARALTQLVIKPRVFESDRELIAEDVDQPLVIP